MPTPTSRCTRCWPALGGGVRSGVSTLAGLLLAASQIACETSDRGVLRYVDLVLDSTWASSTGTETKPVQAFCADETHFAQPLANAETLTTTVTVGAEAQLVVGGCLGGEASVSGASAELDLRIEDVSEGDGQQLSTVDFSKTVEAASGWWRHEMDISAFAERTVRLSLARTGGGGRKLFLRDVFVRHQPTIEQPEVSPRQTARAQPIQILLVSVDTLRADAISGLGGSWPTPRMDELIAGAHAFTRSWSAASWTKPSHASMLTGQPPQVHGALSEVTGLHPALETVSARLGRAGFSTAAVVQDIVHLDHRFGFDRGFDEYRTEHWSLPQRARYAVDWMARHREKPFFFFLHTFETHSDFKHLPYEAPGIRVNAIDERFGVENYGCTGPYCASGRLARINEGTVTPLPNEATILRYLYGQGVQQADAALGTLFDDLRDLGLWDRLMIVLTSDHGEAFLEHGVVLHGRQWEPVMRVPLVIKWPEGALAGMRSNLNVSGLDITPTLLGAAGIEPTGLPGTDLRQLRRGDRPLMLGTYSRTLVHDRFKLTIVRQGEPMRLFDVGTDPQEQDNLIDRRPRVRKQLLDHLNAHLRASYQARDALDREGTEPAETTLSDEERKRLQALGYLGG